jgi:hypothetical protein
MLKGAQASSNASTQMVDLMTYVNDKMKSGAADAPAVSAPASPGGGASA